jgi:hypothetical protein
LVIARIAGLYVGDGLRQEAPETLGIVPSHAGGNSSTRGMRSRQQHPAPSSGPKLHSHGYGHFGNAAELDASSRDGQLRDAGTVLTVNGKKMFREEEEED